MRKAGDPARYPVTRYEAPGDKPASTPSAVVLDDCDETFEAGWPHHDGLRILRASDTQKGGSVKSIIQEEYNACQTIGAIHCLAVNAAGGRIYLCELAGNRVTALDFQGRKLWQVGKVKAGALAVDPKTGRLWCSVGSSLAAGETVVFDGAGREVASFPLRGVDIAYDPHTEAFWLVGDAITKVTREGKVLFQKPGTGWAFVSAAVNPNDGSVWIVERAHPQVARSVNRLFVN